MTRTRLISPSSSSLAICHLVFVLSFYCVSSAPLSSHAAETEEPILRVRGARKVLYTASLTKDARPTLEQVSRAAALHAGSTENLLQLLSTFDDQPRAASTRELQRQRASFRRHCTAFDTAEDGALNAIRPRERWCCTAPALISEVLDDTSYPRMWIASYPRSGNSWLRALITGASCGIFSRDNGPNEWKDQLKSDFSSSIGSALGMGVAALHRFFNEDLLEQHQNCINLWKAHEPPAYSARVPVGSGLALGFMVVVRNPIDMILGSKFDWGLRHESFRRGIDTSTYRLDVPSTVRTALRVNETWHQWINAWPSLPLRIVRYEDLITRPRVVLRRTLDFLGYEYSESSLNRTIAALPFRQPHPEPSFTHFLPASLDALDGILGEWIDRFGYRAIWEKQKSFAHL